ncbi:transcriptional regulator GcvA [Rhizobium sp. Root483D2]|uniref:transcriptional regulator GcvA n=1 Tax=Rhizobium sp. Root483D2 TaxID=1736545 RepID=UPI000712B4B7|nr:transcriptional regulator GcvA [Rhizobium sp. Root483D2]KQY19330.1 transcriptional regulator [Rhizobium sp. Root483D2]
MTRHIPGTRSLQVLEAAGRHCNFTRAAAELGLTPAAISHQIKELEAQFGVTLFERKGRGLHLTPSGEILQEAAAEALAALRQAVIRARRSQGQQKIRLDVTAPTSFAAKWLVPRLDRFSAKEPNADVRLNVTCDVQDFDRDDVDVAIRFGPGHYPGLSAERLFGHVIYPVCSPTVLQGARPLATPQDLLRHTLIQQSWSGQGVVWPDWHMWMLAAGIEGFEPKPGLHYTDTHLAIQAAIDGQGIALGDEALVADDLTAGRLVRPFALSIGGPPDFAYFVVFPPGTMQNPLAARFIGWLHSEAQTLAIV